MPKDLPSNSNSADKRLAVANGIGQNGTADGSFDNFAKVTASTLSQTPSAFYDEISRDLHHPAELLAHVASGVAVGAVGTVLLKCKPVAVAAATLGLAWQGYEAYNSFSTFAGKASHATTEQAREQLAQASSHNLGRSLATFTEATPGMVVGGWAASRAFGAPPLYTGIRDKAAFIGPGTERLPASIISSEGKFDALEVSRIFGEKHSWQGVETGRSLDLQTLKLSRPVSGTETSMKWIPGTTKPSTVPFHIHGPNSEIGIRPSITDIQSTRNLGIIKRGDQFAFYVGHGDELELMQQAGKVDLFKPGMRTVVVDHAQKTAQRLTGRYDKAAGWFFDDVEKLDYGATLKALKTMDIAKPWSTLSSIGGTKLSAGQSAEQSLASVIAGR